MVHLLMLAMLLLPWQALSAQTEMLLPSTDHKCQHAEPQLDGHEQHVMSCCDKQANHCNQNCHDCFHCQSITAVLAVMNLDIEYPYPYYSFSSHETHSGLPPNGQFRPPRSLV